MSKKIDYDIESVRKIYQLPFNDLLYKAHQIHREHHSPNKIQVAELLSIKTGACPEDCGYCSQSGHFKTHVEKEKLIPIDTVIAKAKAAKARGATRYCMGAAWRNVPDKAIPQLQEMITEVKNLGLETCMTLGMLNEQQAKSLKDSGLDYYNHNIDTSPSYYEKVVTTRQFSDRLDTLNTVRKSGIKVCCGGIMGLGESPVDRLEFLAVLSSMDPYPESVPINRLIPVEGTRLAKAQPINDIDLVRTIATARVLMPKSVIRLTAGRTEMSDILQASCFFAGANSVFIGEVLLTEENPMPSKDQALFSNLGLEAITNEA